jgi:sulfite oxidase
VSFEHVRGRTRAWEAVHLPCVPLIIHSKLPLNAETPRASLVPPITPTASFYVRNHGPVPVLDAARWRVRVDGLVERELELSVDGLRAEFDQRRLVATLQCAGNRRAGLMAVRDIPGETPWGPGATGTARWRGVALADVLAAAGLRDEARHIELVGAERAEESGEPFGGSIPRRKALAGEVLLAWEMNGEPLTPEHGAPLRVVVPGYIGARSVKWLERITALAEPSENFFLATAYRLIPADDPDGEGVALGAVAVNADVLVPADGDRVPAGPLTVAGYAFAGDDRTIVRVDVSTDDGRHWREAELLGAPAPWAWRRWRLVLDARPGPLEIVARAWDSAAATQPEDPAALWNPKGYVNNSWARVRVDVG